MQALIDILNRREINFSLIDFQDLIKQALHHRVTGLIHSALNDYPLASEKLRQLFKHAQQKNSQNALKQLQSLIRINHLFQQAAVPYFVLKGLPLSQRLYGDFARRQSIDIDILIDYQDLIKVDMLLKDAGYRAYPDIKLYPNLINKLLLSNHDIIYIHPNSQFRLELHFQLNDPYNLTIDFKKLWEKRRSAELMRHQFHVLPLIDEWLYLCAHGSKHGWIRLRWIYDIVEYQRTQLPKNTDIFWQVANKKAYRYGAYKHCQLAVDIAQYYFPKANAQTLHEFPLKKLTNNLIQIYQKPKINNKISIAGQVYQELLLWKLTSRFRDKLHLLLYRPRNQFWLIWAKKRVPICFFFLCYPAYVLKITRAIFRKIFKRSEQ
jgi:hypothetical protein